MLRVALRANVWTSVGFAALATFLLGFMAAAYAALGTDRATAGRDLEAIGPAFSFILPLPERLDTNAGYVAWFGYGQLALIFAFWGVLAGTYAARGEEERGLADLWLSAGTPRWRMLLSHVAAFTIGVTAALTAGAVACLAIAWATGEPISFGAIAGQSAGVLALAVVFFALGLVTGQLQPTRRGALGIGALVLVALFLTNSFSRQWDALSGARWLSPFAYYDRVHGLVPGLAFGTGSLVVLILIAAVGVGVALRAFLSRDIGATLGRRGMPGAPRRLPATNPLLRSQILATLYDQRVGLLIWCLAIAWQSFFVTRMAGPFLRALALADPGDPSAAQLRVVTGVGHGSPFEGFVGFEWFGSLAGLALAGFAITQVARWSGDDTEGRLEALLSAPLPRTRVVIERALALGVGALLLVATSHAGIAVGAVVNDTPLDGGRLAIAGLMLLPIAAGFGGIGAAASAWRPRVTVAVLAAFAVGSFMIPFMTPVIHGPEWLNHLSVFDLYGTPLAEGFTPWRLGLLAGVSVLGFAVALLAMLRRDVGS
jgi:ABC-2 type transport system permease protein